MTGNTVAAELGIEPAQSVLVINAPGDYGTLVGGLPPGTTVTRHRPADVVHAFAGNLQDLAEHGPVAVASVLPGGLVWVSYPKGDGCDIKPDQLRDAIHGWRPDTEVAIDDVWSAMRFRPESEVE